jgi:UPF0755 protein
VAVRLHARPARLLGRHPWRLVIAAAVVAVLLVVVAIVTWVEVEAAPSGSRGAQVIVDVRAGTGTAGLADALAHSRVIGSALAFRLWTGFHDVPLILPGYYAFDRGEGFGAIAAVVGNGPNVFSLVVPPGFTVAEVAHRLGELPGHTGERFLALATSGTVRSPWQPAGSTNLDGLLGTGSYRIVPGLTDATLLREMIGRFDAEAARLSLANGAAREGLTPYQAITAASIVQKEGVIQKNLGPVARVVLNRLAKGMPLQMDSTVLYALGQDGGTVTKADLALPSPYNSYLHAGLTPTPICFPSTAALSAMLSPPPGNWLYFVVVEPDGTEAFSTTFAEQLANEALAQKRGLP